MAKTPTITEVTEPVVDEPAAEPAITEVEATELVAADAAQDAKEATAEALSALAAADADLIDTPENEPEPDLAEAPEAEPAGLYVHKPLSFHALTYMGSEVVYPAPFDAAIYDHSNFPLGATVMTPEGPVRANLNDWLVSEEGSGMVRVFTPQQFEAHFEAKLPADE